MPSTEPGTCDLAGYHFFFLPSKFLKIVERVGCGPFEPHFSVPMGSPGSPGFLEHLKAAFRRLGQSSFESSEAAARAGLFQSVAEGGTTVNRSQLSISSAGCFPAAIKSLKVGTSANGGHFSRTEPKAALRRLEGTQTV